MRSEAERASDRERSKRYRKRMRDKGYRLLHGRFTDAPHINRTPTDPPPPHGTRACYYWNGGCHCAECRAEVAKLNREYRRRQRLGLA